MKEVQYTVRVNSGIASEVSRIHDLEIKKARMSFLADDPSAMDTMRKLITMGIKAHRDANREAVPS